MSIPTCPDRLAASPSFPLMHGCAKKGAAGLIPAGPHYHEGAKKKGGRSLPFLSLPDPGDAGGTSLPFNDQKLAYWSLPIKPSLVTLDCLMIASTSSTTT